MQNERFDLRIPAHCPELTATPAGQVGRFAAVSEFGVGARAVRFNGRNYEMTQTGPQPVRRRIRVTRALISLATATALVASGLTYGGIETIAPASAEPCIPGSSPTCPPGPQPTGPTSDPTGGQTTAPQAPTTTAIPGQQPTETPSDPTPNQGGNGMNVQTPNQPATTNPNGIFGPTQSPVPQQTPQPDAPTVTDPPPTEATPTRPSEAESRPSSEGGDNSVRARSVYEQCITDWENGLTVLSTAQGASGTIGGRNAPRAPFNYPADGCACLYGATSPTSSGQMYQTGFFDCAAWDFTCYRDKGKDIWDKGKGIWDGTVDGVQCLGAILAMLSPFLKPAKVIRMLAELAIKNPKAAKAIKWLIDALKKAYEAPGDKLDSIKKVLGEFVVKHPAAAKIVLSGLGIYEVWVQCAQFLNKILGTNIPEGIGEAIFGDDDGDGDGGDSGDGDGGGSGGDSSGAGSGAGGSDGSSGGGQQAPQPAPAPAPAPAPEPVAPAPPAPAPAPEPPPAPSAPPLPACAPACLA